MASTSDIAGLDDRLRRLEDESAIQRLIMPYGPAADAGMATFAGDLWSEDDAYDWDADGQPRRMADEQGEDYATHRAKRLRGVALRDISSTDDVTNLALFLASDESRTITGQSIPVDAGGYLQG